MQCLLSVTLVNFSSLMALHLTRELWRSVSETNGVAFVLLMAVLTTTEHTYLSGELMKPQSYVDNLDMKGQLVSQLKISFTIATLIAQILIFIN